MRDLIVQMRNHERRWLVLFLPLRVHWTMRWVAHRRRAWAHVALLSPIGNGQWIAIEWQMRGLFAAPLGEVAAGRMMAIATEILAYDQVGAGPLSVLNSLLPNTCMTIARQALGLPARLNFFRSGWQLRCELLARGAKTMVGPTEGWPDEHRWWGRRRRRVMADGDDAAAGA